MRAPAGQFNYIDLEPGWRLRVIVPITRSGKYVVNTAVQQQSGSDVTMSVNHDFIGYETDYYAIDPHGRHGLKILFASAEQTIDGKTTPESAPRLRLFQLARDARYVRLLYLRRESDSDHDMAVLATSKPQLLAQLTSLVQTDPQNCVTKPHEACYWIPAGIAVRPEKRDTAAAGNAWLPAH